MMTINNIDFAKLKPYDGKVTNCFEQLCYQIAQNEYGHLGTFTPIDGSGGDGGVEFYLQLYNGEKWGWQCKFFGDTGRLSAGNRKAQIITSLESACRNHSDLTKWILCLKTDLTEDSISKSGAVSKGELNWFRNELAAVVPKGNAVKLEHWGESSFVNFLKKSVNIGVRGFFFGELELNQDWFKQRFDENFEKVKDKYDPYVHSIDKFTQSKIDFIVFDSNYIKIIDELKKDLLDKFKSIEGALYDFRTERMISRIEEIQRESFYLECNKFKDHKDYVLESIIFVESCFRNGTQDNLVNFDLKKLNSNFDLFYNKIENWDFDFGSSIYKEVSELQYLISDFNEIYNNFFRNYFHDKQRELHFIGDAAKGKTHLSCDIAFKKIEKSEPVIFITGDKFTNETNIIEALRKILDISQEFTFDEFLKALDTYASILNIKIPIIIDGLNETVSGSLFSHIWENHLNGFITKVLQTRNLVIFTTCRSSYKKRIWANASEKKFHNLKGFANYDTVITAVKKYFIKYHLKTDLFFASAERFRDPIFLKIFCEIKNPNWRLKKEVAVNIEAESHYEVFKDYLNQVNRRVTSNSQILRNNEQFITGSLNKFSKYLWINNLREISSKDFYKLIDGTENYIKDQSKADILISEGLVVTRDMRDDNEYISFTYDMLAGYIIAEMLINEQDNLSYFTNGKFVKKIFNQNKQHPLYEDVIYALCLLLPQIKNITYHELLKNSRQLKFTRSKIFSKLPKFFRDIFSDQIKFSDYTFSRSVSSLFMLPGKLISIKDLSLISELFLIPNENKSIFFKLFFKTLGDVDHPFNAKFLSELLESLKMNDRDICWTEYIRKESHDLEIFISEFEVQSRVKAEESEIISKKQHLAARIIAWFLTSTNRSLRDKSTKALYFYGRKFPVEFINLVEETLMCNDPYVWERTVASLYGVAMAEHNQSYNDKFRNDILPLFGKKIYDLFFREGAPYSTTHILARDYARRTIEIVLLYHPTLFNEKEIENLRPPYSFGGIRELGEFAYGDREYSFSGPIHMDFSNYTIGRIVANGHAYSNPPEKQKVRRQIYWRIYDLGWNEELFRDVENSLGDDVYYSRGRTEQAVVERYGKKYSWIAFFENAGLREDLGLIEFDEPRISQSGIDPSFPKKSNDYLLLTEDLLGDRAIPLVEWYENGGNPVIEEYLNVNNLKGQPGEWICLDAFISQEDIISERNRFVFIRSVIINNSEFDKIVALLENQSMGGRWLPEKKENYYTFAGELYYCSEATYDNDRTLTFKTNNKKIKVKSGDPGYYPAVFYEDNFLNGDLPDEIEIEVSENNEFEVLMPVMEYNWESHHSVVNDAGHTSVVGKEIANHLKLINQPQSFDLLDEEGKIASMNVAFHKDYNNNQSFVYLRKDQLDKYLSEVDSKLVFIIWGERDVRFKTDTRRKEYFDSFPFKKHQVFQKIIKY